MTEWRSPFVKNVFILWLSMFVCTMRDNVIIVLPSFVIKATRYLHPSLSIDENMAL